MSNFLRDYAVYTDGNECPTIYHVWSAFATLSNYIGRRVWTPWGIIGNVYCQLYMILVGDPGCKKSTAMRISREFIRLRKDMVVAPASVTKEAITQMMGSIKSPCKSTFTLGQDTHVYSHLAIYADEFVNLINAGGNPIGMIDFFTEIWGQDVFRETTKHQGDHEIVGPYVTILACMTTDSIKTLMAQKIVSGGMTRRCLFVLGKNEGKSVPFPEETPAQRDAFLRLRAHGERLKSVAGVFHWLPAGKHAFEQWYHTNTKQREREADPILQQFYQTKPEYVIKIAMLIALSEYEPRLEITEQTVLDAIDLVTLVERGSSEILRGTGRNPLASVAHDIMRALQLEVLPVKKKELWKTFRGNLTWEEYLSLMESLEGTGEVQKIRTTQQINGIQVVIEYYTNAADAPSKAAALQTALRKGRTDQSPPAAPSA